MKIIGIGYQSPAVKMLREIQKIQMYNSSQYIEQDTIKKTQINHKQAGIKIDYYA